MARHAGKHGGLRMVESALRLDQNKQAKAGLAKQQNAKKSVAKHQSTDDESSEDESMHNMEERIPRKKGFSYKNVRINSQAKVVDIEDSDDERKMPARASKKMKKADIDPMDTDEEDKIDNKIHCQRGR
jgi:hypothetical protein